MFDPNLLDILREARHIVVFTGAGVSAESDIPTFLDAQTGLWKQFDALRLTGLIKPCFGGGINGGG